jgi:hypothetical protein
MSCLYSSPEVVSFEVVKGLEVEALRSSSSPGPTRQTSRAPNCGAVRFHKDFAVCRGQQARVPQQSGGRRRLHQINTPANTSTGFSREFSSAISGFRSLCGRKQRSSLKPSRSIGPAFWNLSLGAGSRFENSGLHPHYPQRASTGPATLDRCCGRNVVAPGEYSKWFFWISIGLYKGNIRPATARGRPARSALGGLGSVNPAADISRSTSLL